MNGLQLNPNKSENIQFIATHGRDRIEDATSPQDLNAPSTIKSFDVTIYMKLSLDEHVTNVC